MAINFNHITNSLTPDTGVISMSSNTGFKNRIINGRFSISQRGTTAQTVTAGNTIPATLGTSGYFIDRWFTYSLGANVTIQSLTSTATITGAASVTEVGLGQRIEALNSQDLAGSTVTLSFNTSNSLLTTLNLSVSYANTSDTFGTIGTPTKTSITTKAFTITSTLSTYTYSFAVPAAAITGIEILFTVGAMTSGTWVLTNIQLELGNAATAYDFRPIGIEYQLCRRYLEYVSANGFTQQGYLAAAGTVYHIFPLLVSKRVNPNISTTWSFLNGALSSTTIAINTFSVAISVTAAGNWWITNGAVAIISAEL